MPHSSVYSQASPASTLTMFQLWLLSGNSPRTSTPSRSITSSSGSASCWITSHSCGSTRRQAQVLAQVAIGHDVNARDLRAAQVERDAVRFLVIERCQQPFS